MLILSLLLSLVLSTAQAANPCRGMRTYEDPFAGTTQGFVVRLDLQGYEQLVVVQDKAGLRLELMAFQTGASRILWGAGTPVQVALEDGSVVTLATESDAPPNAGATSAVIYTQWKLILRPSAEQAAALRASTVKALRVGDEAHGFTTFVPPKSGAHIQDALACFVGT